MLTLLLTALPHRLGEGVSHRGYPLRTTCAYTRRATDGSACPGERRPGARAPANSVVAWTCRRPRSRAGGSRSSARPLRRFVVPVDQLPHQ